MDVCVKEEVLETLIVTKKRPRNDIVWHLLWGLLKGIVSGLALNGYTTVTFDMRGIGKSTSRASLTGFSEVKDVIVVCNCLSNTFSVPRILLLGSSISAPIAGSAIDQIEQVIGYVSIGYPFRMNALILFG
ncbi:hypothetical protein JHK82_031818 [Glycine max]|nr:hypothetical protein JHK82_031818 [Glycine max]